MKNKTIPFALFVLLSACADNKTAFDASGTFEASEVIVSSELNGKLIHFSVQEGDLVQKDSVAAVIDAKQLVFQKEQVEQSVSALGERTTDVEQEIRLLNDQLQVQQSQLDNAEFEKKRIQNLLKQDAATGKQLDDINASIEVLRKQMLVTRQQVEVQRSGNRTRNRGVLSETGTLKKKIEQINDQVARARIINPITGTILARYAEEGEFAMAGRPLYKIADLQNIYLRSYITAEQLSAVRISQPVSVFIDSTNKTYIEYPGIISWISAKAEFTPKTIQTKEERANLVYAIKVRVKNDGRIKLGMYGELKLN